MVALDQSISDSFDRADSTTLGTVSSGDYTWTEQNGTALSIVSNKLGTTGLTNSQAYINTQRSDYNVSVTVATASGSQRVGILFRNVDASNHWRFLRSTAGVATLYRTTAGASDGSWTSSTSVSAGDVLRVVNTGSLIKCYVNGTETHSMDSSSHVDATRVGLTIIEAGGELNDFSFVPSSPADAVGLTDAVSAVLGYSGTVADAEGLTDAVTKGLGRAVGDPEGLTDSLSYVLSATAAPSDPEGLTDAVTAAFGYGKTYADIEGLTDTVSASWARAATVTDTEGLTDTVSASWAYGKTCSDAEGLTDAVTTNLARTATHADAEGLTDSLSYVLTYAKTVADAEGLTDAVSASWAYGKTVGDVEGLTDSLTYVLTYRNLYNSAVGLADTVAWTLSGALAAAAADTVGLTDSVTAALAGMAPPERSTMVGAEDRIPVVSEENRVAIA